MNDRLIKPAGLLDRTAIALSSLCVVHCLALPVLIAVLPFLAHFGDDHWHAEVLIVVLPVSLLAFSLGYRRHRNRPVIAAGLDGAMLLVIGGTVVHATFGTVADRIVTIVASLLLAIAHYRNNRLSKHVALPTD